MTPLDLLLYLLAATVGVLPLLIILAGLVNLVLNNHATHRAGLDKSRRIA